MVDEKIAYFTKIINEVLEHLPETFTDKLDNVEFVVEYFPTKEFLKEHGFENQMLLGLYAGIPLNRRGVNYNWVLPDRIYIFTEPITFVASMENISIEEKIKKVVLHEIGHYFGMSEEELRNLGVY